jgi:hypothetical protein
MRHRHDRVSAVGGTHFARSRGHAREMQQPAMRGHHALGLARRARGVDQQRDFMRERFGLARGGGIGVGHHEWAEAFGRDFLRAIAHAMTQRVGRRRVREQHETRAAVRADGFDFALGQPRVDDGRPRTDFREREQQRDHGGTVFGDHHHAVAGAHALFAQEALRRLHVLPKLAEAGFPALFAYRRGIGRRLRPVPRDVADLARRSPLHRHLLSMPCFLRAASSRTASRQAPVWWSSARPTIRFRRSRHSSGRKSAFARSGYGETRISARVCAAFARWIAMMPRSDTQAGTAAATNSADDDQFRCSSAPPSIGPTTEPIRPTPRLQPMPVERSEVG